MEPTRMKKIRYDFKNGYLTGVDLFYRCKLCDAVLSSQPDDSLGCVCGNIFIDIDYARISVKCNNDIELLKIDVS